MLLLLIALRTAWPAFAFSIKDDNEAKRTYGFVLTYVVYASLLASLGAVAVRALARAAARRRRGSTAAPRVVPLLVFGATAFIAFNVMSIGIGRAKRTQFNWVVDRGGGRSSTSASTSR